MLAVSTILFLLLTLGVVLFQLALLGGAPWGEFTLGGRVKGVLPLRWRFVPLVSVFLLSGFAAIVAARAGFAFPALQAASHGMVWLVVAYCALGVLLNAITPSRLERKLWLPVTLLMLGASVAAAVS